MTPGQVLALITLASQLEEQAVKFIAEIKAQHGLSDEQLLAAAESEDQATRDRIAAYLQKLGSAT